MSFLSAIQPLPTTRLSLTILCVDDDKSVRTYFRSALSLIVENVIEAENGEDGLAMFQMYKPDITLIDVQMPHVNGMELAKKIRTLDAEHPIIICSVMQDPATFLNFIAIGIDSYVVKPVRPQQLYDAVQQCATKILQRKDRDDEYVRQQASLEAFYQMFENASEAVAIISARNHTVLSVNSVICSLLQVSRGDIVGTSADDFFIAKNLRWLKVLRLQTQPVVYEAEVEITQADGTIIFFAGRSVEFYNKLGELCIGIIAHDITASHQAYESLRENEKHYRALVSNVPGALYSCDVVEKSQRVRFISDYIVAITEHPAIKFVNDDGTFFRSLILPQYHEDIAHEVRQSIDSAGGFEVEYQLQTASGEIKWILERGQTIVNEEGTVISLDGILFDVTRRKISEEKLQQTNVDLQASQQQLQELNASKDKFFSIISHDLRSPFNGIIGSTEVLLNSIDVMDKPDITDGIRDVHKTLKALYEFIENLLTWSRAQTKGLVYAPVPLQLYEVAQAVTFLLKENTAKKSILVTIDVPEDLVVFADYNMVRSVLHNLFSNAIKFTPLGGSISIQASSKEGMAHITVQDSGVGMSESAIAKLFRIDVHHTTLGTNNEKGTGLGLILCKEMIERNGGTITIRSKEGEGATFECTLPLALS